MKRSLLSACCATTLLLAAPSVASAQLSAKGGAPGVPVAAPTGGPIAFQLDDGTAENAIGLTNGGQLIWLNRFTPASFPFQLQEVHVLFRAADFINVGELFDVYVFSDTDGDGNPATGAALLGSETNVAVAALDSFTVVTLTPPILVAGPGDLLLAVANETAGTGAGEFPAALDQTASQGRSWVGFYAGVPPVVPDPPTWPPTTFSTIDSAGFPGNWMIRGVGAPVGYEYPPSQAIPTLGMTGLAALVLLSASAALFLMARRRRAS